MDGAAMMATTLAGIIGIDRQAYSGAATATVRYGAKHAGLSVWLVNGGS